MFVVRLCLFCFTATATTDIDTYWHTLSLHAALPIFALPAAHLAYAPEEHTAIRLVDRRHHADDGKGAAGAGLLAIRDFQPQPQAVGDAEFGPVEIDAALAGLLEDETRSEEHTSELQSLMRISYAVFCLTKKKNIEHNT